MHKRIFTSTILGVLCLVGCSPKVTTTLIKAKAPLDPADEVAVLQPEDSVSGNAMLLEIMRISGKEYEPLVDIAVEKAREAGGNTVRIAEHLTPDISSARHRVAAVAYWADDSLLPEPDSLKISDDDLESELSLHGTVGASWRISLQGGMGYRLGKLVDNLETVEQQHLKNMRLGWIYGADVTYFFNEYFGLGVKFQNLYTSDQMPASATDTETGKVTNGYLENYDNIWFAGPMFTYRLPSRNRKNAFFARVGLGATGYSDWGRYVKQDLTYSEKGMTVGLMYELGYDFGIAKNLSIGASLTFLNAGMNSFDVTDSNGNTTRQTLEANKLESLGYIGLSFGLRYNL